MEINLSNIVRVVEFKVFGKRFLNLQSLPQFIELKWQKTHATHVNRQEGLTLSNALFGNVEIILELESYTTHVKMNKSHRTVQVFRYRFLHVWYAARIEGDIKRPQLIFHLDYLEKVQQIFPVDSVGRNV